MPQPKQSKNFFRILGVLSMGEIFLPVVFERIFFPLSSPYLYILLWVISLLLYYPKILSSRVLLYVYLLSILYLTLMYIDVYDIEFIFIRREIVPLFYAILIFQYFKFSGDYKGMEIVIKAAFLFITITLITSILGLQQYPTAARELAGDLAKRGDFERIQFYRMLGIAGYGFFTGLAFIFPVLISLLKIKKIKRKKQVFILGFILLGMYGLILSQFTTALIFGAMGGFLGLWSSKNPKRAIRLFIFIVFAGIISSSFLLADVALYFSRIIPGETLQHRLWDLSLTLREGVSEADTHASDRAARIPFLLNNFIESPIFGTDEETGHVFWLDRLSMFGLIGIIPWILIVRNQMKENVKIFRSEDKIYYLIPMILFIAIGFMKNMGGKELMMYVFFLIPGFNLIKRNIFKSLKN